MVLVVDREVGVPESRLAPVVDKKSGVLLDVVVGLPAEVEEVVERGKSEVILVLVIQGHPRPPVWLLLRGCCDGSVPTERSV